MREKEREHPSYSLHNIHRYDFGVVPALTCGLSYCIVLSFKVHEFLRKGGCDNKKFASNGDAAGL